MRRGEKLEEKKRDVCKKLNIPEEGPYSHDNVISYDESFISAKNLIKEYEWSKKGVRACRKIDGRRYRDGRSMLLAISSKKTVAYKLIQGSVKAHHICDFLVNEVIKENKNIVISMDNARTHHSKIVTKALKKIDTKIVYSIPYNWPAI